MELLAVIVALEQLKFDGSEVTIYSDSQYVVNSVTKGWVFDWESKQFKNRKNADLWRRFLPLYRKHRVRFVWLKGHAGHPENELCDRMAVSAAHNTTALLDDVGYNENDEFLI